MSDRILDWITEETERVKTLDNKNDLSFNGIIENGTSYASYTKESLIEIHSLRGLNLDIPIYRIVSLSDFLGMLRGCLRMSNPLKWDDKWEQFWYKKRGYYIKELERQFVSCWSTREECDALWRIHGKESSDCIKVMSTPRKLMEQAHVYYEKVKKTSADAFLFYIGRVNYDFEDKEIKIFHRNTRDDVFGVYTNFIKRITYNYENEVRFVYYDGVKKELKKESFYLDINPRAVIDTVYFSPWSDKNTFENIKKIIEDLGFGDLSISRSELFDSI
ncbi:MAG: hypothetical protein WCH76_03580 [Candidatus Riflemargulisbacteria bacterium]